MSHALYQAACPPSLGALLLYSIRPIMVIRLLARK